MAEPAQVIDNNGFPTGGFFLATASTQKLDGNAGSAQLTTASTGNTLYQVTAPEAFCIEIGTNPTATTNSPFMPAGKHLIALKNGDKLAIIKFTGATAGLVWVTPLTVA